MTSILSAKKSTWVAREDDRFESLYLRQKFQRHEKVRLNRSVCRSVGSFLLRTEASCAERQSAGDTNQFVANTKKSAYRINGFTYVGEGIE